MARVGILNCSNMSQDVGCCSFGCLEAAREGSGTFAAYGGGQIDVVGVINCAGCPTTKGAEKILNRVRTLTGLGVDAIHFSTCVAGLCPFVKKYASVIRESAPEVNVVVGTHPMPEGELGENAQEAIVGQIVAQRPTMVDLAKQAGLIPA